MANLVEQLIVREAAFMLGRPSLKQSDIVDWSPAQIKLAPVEGEKFLYLPKLDKNVIVKDAVQPLGVSFHHNQYSNGLSCTSKYQP